MVDRGFFLPTGMLDYFAVQKWIRMQRQLYKERLETEWPEAKMSAVRQGRPWTARELDSPRIARDMPEDSPRILTPRMTKAMEFLTTKAPKFLA
eukprot:SAG31_NODE_14903_length_781_cov_1.579179_1_plen_93_part_10